MKKDSAFVANLLLYFGGAFFVFLLLFAILVPLENHHIVINYLPTVAIASALPVLYLSIRNTKLIHQIFIGFELLFWGIIFVLRERQVIPYSFLQWWPIIGVTAGAFLFIAGFVKYRKILIGYFISSLALFLMGIWFMLFSFKIIKVPFRVVALVGGPLFIIMSGTFIVALFLLQKNHSNLVVQDEDNIDTESDEIAGDGE